MVKKWNLLETSIGISVCYNKCLELHCVFFVKLFVSVLLCLCFQHDIQNGTTFVLATQTIR